MRSRWQRVRAVAIIVVGVALALTGFVNTAMADADDVRVMVEASPTFDNDGGLTVTVSGLDDFPGATVAVYVCGNVSATNQPVPGGPEYCARPGDDGYVTADAEGGSVKIGYTLVATGIGEEAVSCVPATAGPSCQLIVAVATETDGVLIATPLDSVLLGDRVASLPRTGLSGELTVAVMLAGAALIYLGWIFHSATEPARRPLRF